MSTLAHVKNDDVPSSPQQIIDAIPLTIVHPQHSPMEEQRTKKKGDSSQVSKKSSPFAKKSIVKSKKSKSSKSHTMSELYLDDTTTENVTSKGATPIIETTSKGVESPIQVSEILGKDNPNYVETLGVENPMFSENLGKNVLNATTVVDSSVDDPTKGSKDCVDKNLKETIPETTVVPSIGTFVAPATATSVGTSGIPETVHYTATEKVGTPLVAKSGLMRTVSNLGDYYDKLVREFMVNVADNCDDLQNPEYRQVFVRGKCVHFSPSIINKFLGRSDEEVAELEVTDNDIFLNKIAAVNWVPTTHSSNIAKELARFIYVVGTKARFDYGSYVFDATLEHAVSFALQLPIAFPTLLCGIILDQHPTILVDADVPCRSASELTVSKKLLSRTHVDPGVGTSAQRMTGTLSRKQMISELTETSKSLAERKLQVDLVIAALKAEEEADQAKDEHDGQEEDETSGSDGYTEEMVEDSDESSFI
ncbi:unnamed protein product [Trifolium pratense]|uniref:Uncharacterized protein n=1 Tax=Trifolium pratense TaxID=57577 RepID=A0ACB0I792_TRIPR|nr:unnamed protein product [Trifolium pratense]